MRKIIPALLIALSLFLLLPAVRVRAEANLSYAEFSVKWDTDPSFKGMWAQAHNWGNNEPSEAEYYQAIRDKERQEQSLNVHIDASHAQDRMDAEEEKLRGLKKTIWSLYEDILDTSAGIDGEARDNFFKITNENDGLALQIVNLIYIYLRVVGFGMLIICFILDVNKVLVMSGGEFNIKQLMMSVFKFAVGYAAISFGPELISLLFSLNNALIDGVDSLATSGDTLLQNELDLQMANMKADLLEQINGYGIWDQLGAVLSLSLVHIGALFASGIIIFQAVSRKLEIFMRAALMPVAIGDMYNGEQSVGVRSIKKLAAVIVWGFAMIAMLGIASNLSASYLSRTLVSEDLSGTGTLIKIILIPLAAGGMCATLKQVCCDLFGV